MTNSRELIILRVIGASATVSWRSRKEGNGSNGTPPEQKRHVVVESAHCPPRAVFYREALTWLDRYLGPVN